MRINKLHEWDMDTRAARALQEALRSRVRARPLPPVIRRVGGADIALDKREKKAFAVVLILSYPELEMVEKRTAVAPLAFPYVPGLLTFREGPALIAAFEQIEHRPDVVLVDGQGIAHPRRLGLATHLGLWLGVPTVGCAKSRLIGEHEDPAAEKGSQTPLMHEGEQIGVVLRTRTNVKPLFISPGHLSDMESSVAITLSCCRGVRMPQPTRLAHQEVTRLKKEFLSKSDASENRND